jgi:hypothetical protein
MAQAMEEAEAKRRRLLGQSPDVSNNLFQSRRTFCAPATEPVPQNLEGAQTTFRFIGDTSGLPDGWHLWTVPPSAEAAVSIAQSLQWLQDGEGSQCLVV